MRSVIVTTSSSAWLSRHQPVVLRKLAYATEIVQGALTTAIRGISWVALLLKRFAVWQTEIGAPIGDAMRAADLNLRSLAGMVSPSGIR